MSDIQEHEVPVIARTRLSGIIPTIGYACLTFCIYLSTLVDMGLVSGVISLVLFYLLHRTSQEAVRCINGLYAAYTIDMIDIIVEQIDGTNQDDGSLSSVDGEDSE
jgi:hypothetical protein